ncbi:hypothetical protein QTN47_15030 [Danxiaibacter flavus]|uniref:Alpha-L-rhamnosidase six-hairpin glycosidase domain-containing protein n=1 Tax=Danxiaibacter flavus TaxID=3049108 RepID=A0ABV3ZK56_9BACT|nr:hypothetical protein QNM32_15040 [Chitinophagaceae bacterium DXS]
MVSRLMILAFISLFASIITPADAQQNSITFTSSNPDLQTAFSRAKEMALHYKGKPEDPVGPWYESALPPRYAFCMRDVAHQAIPAEALGLTDANKNMFTLFAKNISESKDWCSYWEINRYGKPAPEDYRNDTAFWYNLNANFDIMNACWKLYLWTGDKDYISHPTFKYFHDKSASDYINRWVLQPDSLLTRPAHPNAGAAYNDEDAFHRARGLPSYSEGVPNMKMGIDLVAAIYRGLLSYAAILKENGKTAESKKIEQEAALYQTHIDKHWWDEKENLYNTFYSNKGAFGKNEGETFLFWFSALSDSARKRHTIEHLLNNTWNVENMSYFPYIFYQNGYWDEAAKYMLLLTDPKTERREYPEVSYGVILGFVNGLMGIQPDARYNRVETIYKANNNESCFIENVPLLGTNISVKHQPGSSEFTNNGERKVIWRAQFYGSHNNLVANGRTQKAVVGKDASGKMVSYTDVSVDPQKKVVVSVK